MSPRRPLLRQLQPPLQPVLRQWLCQCALATCMERRPRVRCVAVALFLCFVTTKRRVGLTLDTAAVKRALAEQERKRVETDERKRSYNSMAAGACSRCWAPASADGARAWCS